MVIVGLVATAKYRSLREEAAPTIYSLDNEQYPATLIYIRTFSDPLPLVKEAAKVIRSRDNRIPIISISTIEQEVQKSLWQERMLTLLCGFFAVIALGLARVGIYGALSYAVAAQTRATGIRIALGANTTDLIQSVCRPLEIAIVVSITMGVPAAVLTVRLANQLFFGVQVTDPVSLSLAALVIVILALLAAIQPVIRARSIDPATLLRTE